MAVTVAPFVGAWIEIAALEAQLEAEDVAPFVGAWIEIHSFVVFKQHHFVAPFVGAWIEIAAVSALLMLPWSRTLCGCVD